MNQELKNQVTASFVKRGWRMELNGHLGGRLAYETAVGPKFALVHLGHYSEQSLSIWLKGDYQSEGRNQLSTISVKIPLTADHSEVDAQVEKFQNEVNSAVSKTYAVQLLR